MATGRDPAAGRTGRRPGTVSRGPSASAAEERIVHLLWSADLAGPAPDFTREPLFPDLRRNDEVGVALSAERDAMLADPALPARVRQLRVPALVLHGERDPLPAGPARELAGLLPAGRFAPVPGAGHYPWVEQPRSVAAECRRFLDELGTG